MAGKVGWGCRSSDRRGGECVGKRVELPKSVTGTPWSMTGRCWLVNELEISHIYVSILCFVCLSLFVLHCLLTMTTSRLMLLRLYACNSHSTLQVRSPWSVSLLVCLSYSTLFKSFKCLSSWGPPIWPWRAKSDLCMCMCMSCMCLYYMTSVVSSHSVPNPSIVIYGELVRAPLFFFYLHPSTSQTVARLGMGALFSSHTHTCTTWPHYSSNPGEAFTTSEVTISSYPVPNPSAAMHWYGELIRVLLFFFSFHPSTSQTVAHLGMWALFSSHVRACTTWTLIVSSHLVLNPNTAMYGELVRVPFFFFRFHPLMS